MSIWSDWCNFFWKRSL